MGKHHPVVNQLFLTPFRRLHIHSTRRCYLSFGWIGDPPQAHFLINFQCMSDLGGLCGRTPKIGSSMGYLLASFNIFCFLFESVKENYVCAALANTCLCEILFEENVGVEKERCILVKVIIYFVICVENRARSNMTFGPCSFLLGCFSNGNFICFHRNCFL